MAVFLKYLSFLGVKTVGILILMTIIILPYFLIKQLKLYFRVSQEWEDSTTQHLYRDKREMKKQNFVLDEKGRLLFFKKSMRLRPREFRTIFCVSIVYTLLEIFLFMRTTVLGKDNVDFFIQDLMMSILGCAALLVPLFWIFFVKLSYDLKKVIQQLEETIECRDKLLHMQKAGGGEK